MRKVGILSDAEQTRNKNFKRTQLAKRELVASRLAKAKSIEKELKYADRVPTRVPGGLVRLNLRETMIGMDRRGYVDLKPTAQSMAENNTVQTGEGTSPVVKNPRVQVPPDAQGPRRSGRKNIGKAPQRYGEE